MAEATVTGAELGTLAVSMVANIQNFQMNMKKAMGLLAQFRKEAKSAGINVAVSFKDMSNGTSAASEKMANSLIKARTQITELRRQIRTLTTAVQKAGTRIRNESGKTGREIGRRGKQNLGALLTFQEGVKKFVALNMRWFLTWRMFWGIWGQILRVGTDLKDLFDETAFALRTATDEAGSWVEQWIKGIEIQKMAIAFSMKHAVAMKDVIQTIYYLTTAGISYTNALKFANTAMLTSIALREKAVDTTRLLTGLYNIFGKTIRGVDSDLEAFDKIAAILTATFRKQDIEIHDYIKALPYAAQASKLMGIELEVMVAAMGVLGTHFIRGSKAGTGFQRTLAFMIKHAERFAEITGRAFDPKDEIALVAILKQIGEVMEKSKRETGGFGVATELAGKIFEAAGLRSAKVLLTLADSYKPLAKQIELNYAATDNLVESMAELVERTPAKQLQILGSIFRGFLTHLVIGIARGTDLADALYKINTALEKATPLFSELGAVLGTLIGDFKRLLGLLVAVFWYFKRIAIIEAFRLAIFRLQHTFWGLTASIGSLKLGIFAKSMLGLKAVTITLTAAVASLVKVYGLLASELALIALLVINAANAISHLGRSHEEAMKESAEWAVKDVAAQKSRYEKVADYLIGANLDYRRWTAKERKIARARLRALKRDEKEEIDIAKKRGRDTSQIEATYATKKIQIYKDLYREISGIEATGKDLQALAVKAGIGKLLDVEQEGSSAILGIHKWMDQELAKLEMDRLSFTLWQTEQEFKEKSKGITEGSIEELQLREIYNRKVEKILNDYRIKAVELERKTIEEMRGARLEGFDKELENIEKQRRKITATFAESALEQMKVEIESQKFRALRLAEEDEDLKDHYLNVAATAEKISKVLGEHLAKVPEIGATKTFTEAIRYLHREGYPQLQEISEQGLKLVLENERAGWDKIVKLVKEKLEDIQELTDANNEWIEEATIKSKNVNLNTVRKSYNKQIKDTQKQLDYLADITTTEGRDLQDKINKLNAQKTKLDETWATRRIAIVKHLEEEWIADTEKILQKRYGEYETEWQREISGFRSHYQKLREETRKEFDARVKDFKEDSAEMTVAEIEFSEVLKQLKRNENEDLKKLLKDNQKIYHLYLATQEMESFRTAENISGFFESAFGVIKETWLSAIAAMREEAGTFEENLADLWKNIGENVKTLTSDYLKAVIDGHKYTTDTLTEMWNRFMESLKATMIDWLASAVWQEFLSVFEGRKAKEGGTGKMLESWGLSLGSAIAEGLKGASKDIAEGTETALKIKQSPSAIERIGKAIAEASEREMTVNLKQPLTPAQRTITMSPVVIPAAEAAPIQIVNIVDPNFIPAGMIKNKSIIINSINQDLLEHGSNYQIIKGL